MFKRQYFLSIEVHEDGKVVSKYFRQFWVKSLFRKHPGDVLKHEIEILAEELNINADNIFVNAFNNLE